MKIIYTENQNSTQISEKQTLGIFHHKTQKEQCLENDAQRTTLETY
jgi:hypothetical protein